MTADPSDADLALIAFAVTTAIEAHISAAEACDIKAFGAACGNIVDNREDADPAAYLATARAHRANAQALRQLQGRLDPRGHA